MSAQVSPNARAIVAMDAEPDAQLVRSLDAGSWAPGAVRTILLNPPLAVG